MTEDRQALIQHYRDTRCDLLAAIEGISNEMMAEPSIDGWSVKDHLAHIAAWDEVRTSDVLRISAGHESAWRMTDAQDDAYNTLAYELRTSMSAAQAKWELETTRERLLETLASATDRAFDTTHYGEAGVNSLHEVEHAAWLRRWRAGRAI